MRLTPQQRAEVCTRFARGEAVKALAVEFNVKSTTIYSIINGRTHFPDYYPEAKDPPAHHIGVSGCCNICGRRGHYRTTCPDREEQSQ